MRNQDGRENKTDGAMKSRDKAKNENEMKKKALNWSLIKGLVSIGSRHMVSEDFKLLFFSFLNQI